MQNIFGNGIKVKGDILQVRSDVKGGTFQIGTEV